MWSARSASLSRIARPGACRMRALVWYAQLSAFDGFIEFVSERAMSVPSQPPHLGISRRPQNTLYPRIVVPYRATLVRYACLDRSVRTRVSAHGADENRGDSSSSGHCEVCGTSEGLRPRAGGRGGGENGRARPESRPCSPRVPLPWTRKGINDAPDARPRPPSIDVIAVMACPSAI